MNFFGLNRNRKVHIRKKFRFFSFNFCPCFDLQKSRATGPWAIRIRFLQRKLKKYFMLVYTFKTKIIVTCRVVCKTSSSSRPCWCRPSCPRQSLSTLTTIGPSMTAGRTTANLSATNYPDGPWWSLVCGVW